jgi:two-component system response regulator (stage 0 sporulation protein F)
MDVAKKAVLVIEDEAELRQLFGLLLEAEQIEVFQAADGPEALRLLEEKAGSIGLVVTDMNLPGMTGPEIVARARLMVPDAKILAMSGFSGQSMVNAAGSADAFMAKPFDPMTAVATVKQMLDQS